MTQFRLEAPGSMLYKGYVKLKLLWLALLSLPLLAFSQGKIGMRNDSAHFFVLGTTLPADYGLGGGVSSTNGNTASGTVGAIPVSPLPSGQTLSAMLFAGSGTAGDNLTLVGSWPLTADSWQSAGLMMPKTLVVSTLPGGTLATLSVVIADVVPPAGTLLSSDPKAQFAGLGALYCGTSGLFTFTPGTGISYPFITTGGGTTWAPANVVIDALATTLPPSIISQPQSLSVNIGSQAALNVRASSLQPLTYQWRRNGVVINGATNSALDFVSVALSDAGNYDVVSSNLTGKAVSSNAVLQVVPPGAPSLRVNGELAVGTLPVMGPATVTISGGFPNGILFYTLDGSVPTTSSTVYTGPIILTSNATVQAMSLSADFTQTSVAPPVTVLVTPLYSLQITVNGNGSLTVTPPNGPYPSNTLVTLSAKAAVNWAFDHWTGDLSGTNNPQTLLMNRSRSVGAVFLPTIYPLTVGSPGGGSVTVNGQTIVSNTFYPSGSLVSLAANASNGWSFMEWQGTAASPANPLNLVMNQTNDVQAIFGTLLTRNIGGRGSITMSQPNPVPFGTALTLAALPAPGYHFVAWSGAAGGTNNPTTLLVTNANPVVGAFFSGPPALTVRLTATNTVVVSWPSSSAGWTLLANTNLSTATWLTPTETIHDDGTLKYIIVSPSTGNRFYGLWPQ